MLFQRSERDSDDKKMCGEIMDFEKLLQTKDYEFLWTEPRLGNRIILLGISGSYGYGTNREGSDVDFRGVTLNLPSDLIGLTTFEQFEDRTTDTVIYGFNKLVSLLINCNPNTIELLGLDDNQYYIKSELGQRLLDNRNLFLSKRAAASFGHYADAQLRRLQNAIVRDSLSQSEREQHILRSGGHALEDFNIRQQEEDRNNTRLYIDTAVTEGLETEIFLDADLKHYPLRRYTDMMNTLNSVVRDYDKVGKRNHKKDEKHLNKHAMHLIRLFMMGIDILQNGEIRTHRPKDDLTLLMSIRDGEYMEEGRLSNGFYDILADYEDRFEQVERTSTLPDNPDMDKIEELVEDINRHAVLEDYS